MLTRWKVVGEGLTRPGGRHLKIDEPCGRISLPEAVSIMRLPRWRFTVQKLMLVVALAGLAMGGGIAAYRLWRLSSEYARKAQLYQASEANFRKLAAFYLENAEHDGEAAAQVSAVETSDEKLIRELDQHADQSKLWAARSRENAAECATMAVSYAALSRKYERAARYPWLTVDPDPPPPFREPAGGPASLQRARELEAALARSEAGRPRVRPGGREAQGNGKVE